MKLTLKKVGEKALCPGIDSVHLITSIDQKPKGVCGPVLRYVSSNRLYSKESSIYKSSYFQLRYYPPNHFISIFRKSKPAVNIRFQHGVSFLSGSSRYLQELYAQRKSIVPSSFAVWRRTLTVKIKDIFVDEWYKLGGTKSVDEANKLGEEAFMKQDGSNIAKDGVYMFQIFNYPDPSNMDRFEEEIRKALGMVAKKSWNELFKSQAKNKNWVEEVNGKLNIGMLNAALRFERVPYRLIRKT
ncbi:hypothetical protein KAFR_0J00590 [Kazachstania africana CBS 2517]|uniref:Uncharacterized protein n=1 Tax=Kazachstania africana (strain ATCC 22294 / BCRC 22015 / CBS 2517 / CECT 1963 / NBRC 1671 / NRRL Y-8276) TaxID=1071382 RepID=H2B0H7_KAZAF|nr:hypothetical protein KAFR_0J00590 [Kazachstania africana CBS 2517]CCF60127.1 hypothetical protein KAFR_0J00590 [Kazachstania africana CBS 2517]